MRKAMPASTAAAMQSGRAFGPVSENPAIEGLRGLAALMVMTAHFAPIALPGTDLFKAATTGVDLFFVLSGFVFAPYVLGRNLPLLPHLVRRFFRLYPLYLAALLAYAFAKQPAAEAWLHFPAHALMTHTLGSLEVAFYYNPAFWSLPPEVEFYLALPLFARFGGIRAFALLLPASIVFHEILALGGMAGPSDYNWLSIACVHLPGLLCEFMLGVLAYVLAGGCPSPRIRTAMALGGLALLGTVAIVLAAGGDAATAPAYLRANIGLAAAGGYALAVAVLVNKGPALGSRLRNLCLHTGHLSYGIYLFHNLAPSLIADALPNVSGGSLVAASLVLTLAIAVTMHRLLERPLRNYGRRLASTLQG